MRYRLRTLLTQFTIRDLLWLTAIIALIVVWRTDVARQEAIYRDRLGERMATYYSPDRRFILHVAKTAPSPPRRSTGLIALLLSLPFPVFMGIGIASAKLFGNGLVNGNGPLFLVQVLCLEFGPCISILLSPWQVIYIVRGIRTNGSALAWFAIVPASTVWLYILWAGLSAIRDH